MLSGQVAASSVSLVGGQNKKDAGETALFDLLSTSFGQGEANGGGFSNHLTQLLQTATPRADVAPRVAPADKPVPAPQAAPAQAVAQPKPDAPQTDSAPAQAPEANTSANVTTQDNYDPADHTQATQTLNDATKALKEATKALDDALKEGVSTGEALAALVVAVAQAVQTVQTALEPFQAANIPPSAAPRVQNVLATANQVLTQLQQWVATPQPVAEGTQSTPQQSFADALQTLLGNDSGPVDVQDVVRDLAAQVAAVKNLLTNLRAAAPVQQLAAAHKSAAESAVQTQTQIQGAPSAQPQQITQTAAPADVSAPQAVTAAQAPQSPQAPAQVSAPAPIDVPDVVAKPQAVQQASAVAAPVAVLTSEDAGGKTSGGNQQFAGSQSESPKAQAANAAGAQRSHPLSFEQHIRGASGAKVVEQIQVQMKSAMKDGVSRITVKLDPAELGEVEIKMEIGATGKAGVVISCDRPQTLELLQRDAKQLQQMLTDLGLSADSDSLSFNLRGGDQQQSQQQNYKPNKYSPLSDEFEEEVAAIVPTQTTVALRSGVNIKV